MALRNLLLDLAAKRQTFRIRTRLFQALLQRVRAEKICALILM